MLSNLSHAFPDWEYSKIVSVARESAARMFEMGFFSLSYPFMSNEQRRHTVFYDKQVEAKLEELRNTGKPVLFLIPHTCLFESLATSHLFRPFGGRSLGAIYRPNRNPALDSWITRARQNVGIKTFSRKEGVIKARAFLNKGNWLAILYDQNAGEYGSINLFMQRICSMSILPNLLTRQPDVQATLCFARRVTFFKSKLEIIQIHQADEPLHLVAHKTLEQKIISDKRGFPDWLWSHGKWRTNERPHEIFKLIPRKLGLPEAKSLKRKVRIWVRFPNWLGDIIMAIPVLRLIREERPDCEITIFVGEEYVEWIRDLNVSERVEGLPNKRLTCFKKVFAFRKCYPEFQLLFTNSFRGDLEAFIMGARYRMGLEIKSRRHLLNCSVRNNLSKSSTHQTYLWGQLAAAGGCVGEIITKPEINCWSSRKEGTVIGIAPGSNNTPSKRVPLEVWSSLINLLVNTIKVPFEIKLLGTRKDYSICNSIEANHQDNIFHNLCGRTSLTELDQEIQGLDLLLCSDSGAMHLANFRGVPVFAVFGPTNPSITGPVFDAPKSITEVSSKNFTSVTELDLKEMSKKLESFLKKEILT